VHHAQKVVRVHKVHKVRNVHSVRSVHHPHHLHHIPPTDMDGIDISRHQRNIEWSVMLRGNYSPKFVYARCMGLGLREDVRYLEYIDSAQYHGVPIGTYLFYTNYNTCC
jgi:GH25 family lysozyme M1 (1,4-beta-N-acetylmuramidase)